MTFRTVKAENLRLRTPLAFRASTDEAPMFGTAHKRNGVWVIANAKQHIELKADQTIAVDYEPEKITHLRGVRWCRKCEVTHLRIIQADKHATAYCTASARRYAKNNRVGISERQVARETKRIERDERINGIIARVSPSREQMIASILRTQANVYGTDSTMFVSTARGYNLTVEDAIALATVAA